MSDGRMNLGQSLVGRAIGLGCALALLGISGCGALTAQSPTPTEQPAANIDELKFQDAKTGERFRALNACIEGMVDDSWRSTSYQLVGNFQEARWCTGAGADCQINSADRPDQHEIQLSTLFYPQSYPEVFGLDLNALWVPESTGWSASFYFAENGGSVLADGWQVTFREYASLDGDPGTSLYLGDGYSYRVYETSLDLSSGLSPREDLAGYMVSPEAMRDRGLAQIEALAEKVRAEISNHQAITCDRGAYMGNGIQPACTPRPLTPAEEKAERAKADAYFASQEQLLRDNYQEMYATWMKAFPLNKCWP